MKKVYIISLLFIIGIAIAVYVGHNHREAYNAELKREDEKLRQATKEHNEKEEKARQQKIEQYKPNGMPRSYVDDVRYIQALKQNGVILSTLGSSVTLGTGSSDPSKTWSSLLDKYLQQMGDSVTPIRLNNNGFSGYTAGAILSGNKVDQVVAQNPNIVLFETSIINDYNGSIPIDKTIKNISDVVDKIKSGLPDAEIILLSPNPIAEDSKNKINLTMADYETKTREFILSKGWKFIDVNAGFRSRNANMKTLTVADGVHPNDAGYNIWFEIMKAEFEKKQ